MCGKSGEQGSPSNCWTMQRCTGKGNTKREIDEKREEDLKDGMCIIMGSDRGEKPVSSTDESLRKEHSESINKSAMSTSASTDVLNGLCVNSLADISGLLFNPSNSTALNNLLLGGTGGVTDVNALNALTTPDLLTATAATGMLPFICANLAEFSADQQKMQMLSLKLQRRRK
uniref:Uncharacterized protein n=1 Tax=Parascaris univalens TaxID=6257 RepID=A0A915CBX5_PARUN